jgi:hypothetical protein
MTAPYQSALPAAAVIDGISVDAVAAAAAGCAGVAALDSGQFGEVASYLPGRQVPGVAVRPDSVLVQVRSRWGVRAADLLAQITAAVTPAAAGRRVDVVIGDIDDPPSGPGAACGGPGSVTRHRGSASASLASGCDYR